MRTTAPATVTLLALAFVIGLAVSDYGLIVPLSILGLCLVFLLLTRPFLGLILITVTIPIENAMKVGNDVTFTRVLGILVFAIWLSAKMLNDNRWKHLVQTPFFRLCLALLVFALASMLWAPYPSESILPVLSLAQMIGLTVLIIDLVNSWNRAIWVLRLLVVGALVTSIWTTFQYFVSGVVRAGAELAGGVNETSTLLVTVVPIAFFLIRTSKKKMLWPTLGLLYLISAPVAVLVTFSRQSFLLLPLAFISNYWETFKHRTGRARLVLITAVVVALFAIILGIGTVTDQVVERINRITPELTSFITRGQGPSETRQI